MAPREMGWPAVFGGQTEAAPEPQSGGPVDSSPEFSSAAESTAADTSAAGTSAADVGRDEVADPVQVGTDHTDPASASRRGRVRESVGERVLPAVRGAGVRLAPVVTSAAGSGR